MSQSWPQMTLILGNNSKTKTAGLHSKLELTLPLKTGGLEISSLPFFWSPAYGDELFVSGTVCHPSNLMRKMSTFWLSSGVPNKASNTKKHVASFFSNMEERERSFSFLVKECICSKIPMGFCFQLFLLVSFLSREVTH